MQRGAHPGSRCFNLMKLPDHSLSSIAFSPLHAILHKTRPQPRWKMNKQEMFLEAHIFVAHA